MAREPKFAYDCLVVSAVRIFPTEPLQGLTHTMATAEIVLNDQLILRNIRIREGECGLYISYPSAVESGEPRAYVFPMTKILRDHIEASVLEKYQDAVKKENG